MTLRTTKTRPTIPELAAGAGVCPPRTFRPDVAASSVHEQPFGTPNTLSTSPAECSQSSSPPFSRTPLAIHSFPCATDAVRLAPATDLQRPSTRRGASANQPRRQRRCMLHLLRISLASLMMLTSAQSTATTPAATPPSALARRRRCRLGQRLARRRSSRQRHWT